MPKEMFILSWWFSTCIFQNSLHSVGNSCLTPLPTTPNAFWVVKNEERKNAWESQTLVTALRITDSGHGFTNHRLWSRLCESQTLVTALVVYHEGRLPTIIDFFWLWHYSSILSRSMLDFTLFEILHNCLVKILKWYDIRILIIQRCNHSSVAF